MFFTARSSITITSWSRTRRVLVRWRKSARDARTFRWARATFALALARFAEPVPAAGEPALVAGEVPCPPGQLPGVRDLLPVAGDGEVLDAQVHADHGAGRREAAGIGDVHGEGDVPAPARIPGDRHRGRVDRRRVDARPRPHEASGVLILARNSARRGTGTPERVYSADCRPLRDLYRGYRARLAKKLVNAACWCRIACCSGTEDTSFSHASSSVALHGGQVGVGLGEARPGLLAVVPGVPPARVRFQTTRTQPNVR